MRTHHRGPVPGAGLFLLPALTLLSACGGMDNTPAVEEGPDYGDGGVTNDVANSIGYGASPDMMPSETGAPGASGNATARGGAQ